MPSTNRWASIAMLAFAAAACSKDTVTSGPDTGASASPSVSVAAPPVSASATASASAATEVAHDCPAGSTGMGSYAKPCEAKGSARMLDIVWNGKSDSSGAPSFKVTSKAPKPIVYGRVGVYFYDKAGKQIDVKEPVEGSDKTHAFHTCSGGLFAGVLVPGEKATFNFSCMKKANVPDGAVAMEAEAQIVGFADASGKKSEFYWKNADLTPEARPKGGAK